MGCSGLIPEREGMPPLYQQQSKEVTTTWRFWSINTVTTNTMLIIIIITIVSKNTVSDTHTQERSISSSHSNRSGIHQLSEVAFTNIYPPTLQNFILQAIHLSPIILVFWGLLGVVFHWSPDLSAPDFTKSSRFQKNWRTCLLPSEKLSWGHLWLSPATLTSRPRINGNYSYPTSAPG